MKAHSHLLFHIHILYCEGQGWVLGKVWHSQLSMLNAVNSGYIYGCSFFRSGVTSGQRSMKPKLVVFRIIWHLYCNNQIIFSTDNIHPDYNIMYLSTFSSHLFIRWVLNVSGMHQFCVKILFKKLCTAEAWYKTLQLSSLSSVGTPHCLQKSLISSNWSFSSHILYISSVIQW